jgi:hypothetical protein
MMRRRGFIAGLATALVGAPAIVRTPGLLMPIKPIVAEPPLVIVSPSLYAELAKITKNAFVPKLWVDIYCSNETLFALLNNQPLGST